MSAAQDILAVELHERRLASDRLIDDNFVKQANYIKDKAPRKVSLCTRRAGKSMGVGLDFLVDSIHHPGANYLYMTLTRDMAKKIMWEDVFKDLNRRYNLGLDPNEAELSLKTKNGCKFWLAGADANVKELQKRLGLKLRKAHFDEAGSFTNDLENLIIQYVEPAVSDWEGQVSMSGTPTELTGSYFHKVTTGEVDHGWSQHFWTTYDNPHMVDQWQKQLARLKETYGDVLEELPWYRRMYLGEWVTDLESLVYKYDHSRNSIDTLPEGRYTYLLGIDLGFDDPTAFTLGAYNSHQKTLYILEAYKRSGMIISDVAERIKYYQGKYDIYDMVVDNASKQAVEELKDRFGLPLEAAEKTGKAEFIEIMNSEFIQGKIKLLPEASALADEYASLIWDESKRPKREEHPRCENHISDSCLYLWRKHLAYMSEPEKPEPKTDEERIDQWEEQEAMRVELQNQWNPFDEGL